MCSWKELLLLACTASLILSVASDHGQVDADAQDTSETPETEHSGYMGPINVVEETEATGETQPTGETHATGETKATGETQATGDTSDNWDPNCEPEPRCKKDEVYTDCTDKGCQPFSCSELGFSIKCGSNCKPGCICKDSRLRAANGTCVPQEQCPSCGGDSNAGPGCGAHCINCSNYKKKPVVCNKGCIRNGCECKDGYMYDPNIKKCVRPTECTPTCGLNEVYNSCTNGGCDARNCSQVGKPVPCVKLDPKSCIKGCVCADGYLRASNGTCVPKDQCEQPPKCKKDEVYTDCKDNGCQTYLCSELGFPVKCGSNCKPGCVCKDSLVRAANGTCVPKDQCPSCGGDPHAGPGCGAHCINCSNYKKKPVVCPFSCILNGCECKDGYIYDRNIKKCVRPTECTPTCGLNEVYNSCTNGGCDARNCSQVGKPVPCVKLDPKNCIKGCVCADGYLRASNGTCVPKDQCEQPPRCKKDEEYTDCKDSGCKPYSCSELGFPLKCGSNCKPGCVCKDSLVRAANGTCVPQDQCPSCGGDSNAGPGCGSYCINCSNYKKKPVVCPLSCILNGCQCKDGYIYDRNIKKCVRPTECTPTCGLNEVYNSCTNGGCEARNCSQVGKPVPCVKLDPKSCIKGCVCADGYLRASNGTCVPKDQCERPRCNKLNEVYDVCPAPCPPRRCNVDDRVIRCAAPPKPGDPACQPGCRCADGFARNATGTCVLRSQCEKPLKCKANEVYDSCPAVCPPQKCGVDPALILCQPSPKYGDSACKPACKCVDGYVRNAANVCIPKDQCPPKCGANEVYSSCVNGGCDARNCSQLGKPVPCIDPIKCIKGCVCAKGYLRDSHGTCVPKDQCQQPRCNKLNEVYDVCPAPCPPRRCDVDDRVIKCAAPPKPGDPACQPGCRCADGFARNATGTCVLRSQCEKPLKCKTNEVYEPCPAICPPQKCGVGHIFCPRNPQYGDSACKPSCRCVDGYVRNAANVCIPKDECPPTCGANEVYSYCKNGGCGARNCSQLGKPVPCIHPTECIRGCICTSGYLRDSHGTCVPQDKCGSSPTCGANEVLSSCINGGCDARNCSQLGKPVPCIDPIKCIKGCVCATGYLRDSHGTCVPKDKCGSSEQCGQNAYWETCISGCSNQTCDDIGKIYHCPLQPAVCREGCRCKTGYWRNKDNKCVAESQCPTPPCPDGKIYNRCPTVKCDGDYCPKTRNSPQTCPVGIVCDPPRCTCGFNQKINRKTGKCVAIADCPPFTCNGPHEEYQSCPASCPGENCTDYINDTKCPPYRIGIVVPCKPQCKCKTGYYRNANGVCILAAKCGPKKPTTTTTPVVTPTTTPKPTAPKCGANEVYSTCVNGGCDAKNCSQLGTSVPCIDPIKCIKGCVCATGYLRDSHGTCVPKDKCETSPTCGANEVYSSCVNGGCGARNCSQLGTSVPCIDPIKCIKGCVCKTGYLRNSYGTCVPRDKCGSSQQCGQNAYWETCISGCSNQTCDDIGKVFSCPALPDNCRTGCRCKPGYWRNKDNECVAESQCPSPPCPNGETYNRCPTVKCDGDYCPKTRNSPQTCPVGIICDPPRCTCGFNQKRDHKTGKCIPTRNCPPFACNGPNEEYQPCPARCPGENCTDYINDTKCLPDKTRLICRPQCKCKPGYFRNANGVCIIGYKCGPKKTTTTAPPVMITTTSPTPTDQCAGPNEYFDTCISGCSNQACGSIGKIYNCPIQTTVCRTGCRCKPGYYRNSDNVCVEQSQCPAPPCPDGETYNKCPTVKCDGDYCPKTRDSPQTCPVGIVCDPPRCTCGFNQKRDHKTGKCIPTRNCPPFTCNGPNEEYQPCPVGCPGENCTDYINDSKCPPGRIGIPLICRPQCKCKTGYFRNANGVCIIGYKCGPKKTSTTTPPVVITTTSPTPTDECCGPNEYFDTCIKGCSNQTCDSIGKIYNCPIQTTVCKTGCRCNPGYYRNSQNVCVEESQCPAPPCPDGETYNRCPTVKCDGDYCPKTRNSPQTCPVGIVCDPPRCTCGFNQKRDHKTGKCIPTRNCPPFSCNGPNEEYQPCPVGCPGENCTDYINDSKCPPGRIGIVLICRPQCKCKSGYFRNAKGVCIIGFKCGPKKSTTTPTTTAVTTPAPTYGSGNGLADLQAGVTKFTGQFLYDRMNANKGDNIIVSAFSVFTPLAQLALYATGDSLNQLLTVLNVKSKDEIRTAFPLLTASYDGQTSVDFSTAAKIYCNLIYQLSDPFKKDSIDIFKAETQELDFSKNTEAAATINTWVQNKTNDRIKDLVTPDMLSSSTRLVLANAIYFKGTWLYEFDKKNTKDADFFLSDGSTKKTKLMYQKADFNYGELDDLDCKVLEMFYKGKNISMFIALPNKNNGLIDLADKLKDPAIMNKAYESMRSRKVEVYVPPFEITTTTNLKDILKQLKVTGIFDASKSGLNGILKKPEQIYVSDVIQKAFIKTDEEGSEAAAANAFVGAATAAIGPPPEECVFRADHSFLYYIMIKGTTDIPIFSGALLNP